MVVAWSSNGRAREEGHDMTLGVLDADDDDFDGEDEYVDDLSAVPEWGVSDPQSAIEEFTGATVAHLMRVGYVVAARNLKNKEDREDIVQQAFERVVIAARRRDTPPSHANAYFGKIVLSLIVDKWRRERAVKRGSGAIITSIDDSIHVKDPHPTPEQSAGNLELRNQIVASLKRLSPEHQEILGLALDLDSGDFSRMSHAEIARRLGLEPKTVKSRLHEAKKKLAICLAEWRKEEWS
jgi:RNA polymerase sigma factor (sigma-70 family)